MAGRFHVNCDLAPGPVDLAGPEAHHLAVVLRLRPGSQVILFNGDGREYPAEVESVSKKSVELRVLAVESPQRERRAHLEVAAALPKGERVAWLLEKLTELGVAHFVPLRTAFSTPNPREERLEKWQRHIIEASKQCGRNVLMTVEPLADWQAYAMRADLPARKLIAHPGGAPLELVSDMEAVAVAIGPEAGFRPDEMELGCAAGWRVAGLGPRILRVETAAAALAAWFTLGSV